MVNVNSAQGNTTIKLGGGNDVVRVNYDQDGNQTSKSGVTGTFTLNGNAGADLYEIGVAGNASAVINVRDDHPSADTSVDALKIYGTDQADYFLFRPHAVMAIQVDAQRVPVPNGGVERVNYESDIGELDVYGRKGDDIFVLDDNSANTTIYGDEGNDTFQVGQLFKSPRGGMRASQPKTSSIPS